MLMEDLEAQRCNTTPSFHLSNTARASLRSQDFQPFLAFSSRKANTLTHSLRPSPSKPGRVGPTGVVHLQFYLQSFCGYSHPRSPEDLSSGDLPQTITSTSSPQGLHTALTILTGNSSGPQGTWHQALPCSAPGTSVRLRKE